MDDAVYTFETLLHQELGKMLGKEDLCKSIQRILERVLKVRQPAKPLNRLSRGELDSWLISSGAQLMAVADT